MPIQLLNTNNNGSINYINNSSGGSINTFISPVLMSAITTATLNGSATISATSPFASGNSYSLNGTTSYLSTVASTNFVMGTGDFTVEWFQYQTSQPANPRVFSIGNYSTATLAVSIEGGTFYLWEAGSFRFSYSLTAGGYLNQWVHFAISRISNSTSVYKNGTKIGASYTDNNNINNSTSVLNIGQETTPTANSYFPGYLTNFRIVKGLGVYTGNFTTPTSALTQVSAANPYGGSNTQAVPDGYAALFLVP